MINIQVEKRYRNIKTQDVYVVLNIGLAAWDSGQRLIIYQRAGGDDKTIWVRSGTEFNEKFEEVPNNEI
jgi:hypothetical protein